jgi:hypothetical protein
MVSDSNGRLPVRADTVKNQDCLAFGHILRDWNW